mmetsp:Transcript_44505/g.131862  ORF Transcript_44505/g.131862 Transcript_44505/m.131862 type:complete len:370 (+) Transcript_44505:469-1578(+)
MSAFASRRPVSVRRAAAATLSARAQSSPCAQLPPCAPASDSCRLRTAAKMPQLPMSAVFGFWGCLSLSSPFSVCRMSPRSFLQLHCGPSHAAPPSAYHSSSASPSSPSGEGLAAREPPREDGPGFEAGFSAPLAEALARFALALGLGLLAGLPKSKSRSTPPLGSAAAAPPVAPAAKLPSARACPECSGLAALVETGRWFSWSESPSGSAPPAAPPSAPPSAPRSAPSAPSSAPAASSAPSAATPWLAASASKSECSLACACSGGPLARVGSTISSMGVAQALGSAASGAAPSRAATSSRAASRAEPSRARSCTAASMSFLAGALLVPSGVAFSSSSAASSCRRRSSGAPRRRSKLACFWRSCSATRPA